jgi:hypothetical protein
MQHGPGSAIGLEPPHGAIRRSTVIVAVFLWFALVGGGMGALWRYKVTRGELERPPERFPEESSLRVPGDAPVILVFAHPHCTCTRATLSELAALLTRVPHETRAYVVITGSARTQASAAGSEAFRLASSIDRVRVVADTDGREAELFRARTSGTTIVYDGSGGLAFHGGITGARGHVGDNLGRALALAAFEADREGGHQSDVFGCAIADEETP